MAEQPRRGREKKLKFGGNIGSATSTTVVAPPATAVPATGQRTSVFTQVEFEDALDKVSRPVTKPDRAS
jgi:hypothetical protein